MSCLPLTSITFARRELLRRKTTYEQTAETTIAGTTSLRHLPNDKSHIHRYALLPPPIVSIDTATCLLRFHERDPTHSSCSACSLRARLRSSTLQTGAVSTRDTRGRSSLVRCLVVVVRRSRWSRERRACGKSLLALTNPQLTGSQLTGPSHMKKTPRESPLLKASTCKYTHIRPS